MIRSTSVRKVSCHDNRFGITKNQTFDKIILLGNNLFFENLLEEKVFEDFSKIKSFLGFSIPEAFH